jgi:hypothetical protein
MRLDSSGRLGLGTSSPSFPLHLVTSGNNGAAVYAGTSSANQIYLGNTAGESVVGTLSNHNFGIVTNGGQKVTVTTGGAVGIGTAVPGFALEVASNVDYQGYFVNNASGTGVVIGGISGAGAITSQSTATPLVFARGGIEAARIDASSRLLVGTSTARANFFNSTDTALVQVEGANNNAQRYAGHIYGVAGAGGPWHIFAKHRSNSIGGTTVVIADDQVGALSFQGSDGTEFVEAARIEALVDGTPGANDMPGRLVFSTTSDGSASPTERMRIGSNGTVLIGKTSAGIGNAGIELDAASQDAMFTNFAATPVFVNRTSNDGVLIDFQQDSISEGSISVSGTTVSLVGAHLSRWSQLPGGAEREEILRGTVLSNLDEMCDWGDEDNEQLNRMKVSDVEGDKNVSGVFQAWDDDDDTYTADFYCAMTGDFIIRIAEGITVQRGDLLMSAGDGTATPQDDDIIRSKTIAKVTSTHVTCTYDDGSYCVPCVLMAC